MKRKLASTLLFCLVVIYCRAQSEADSTSKVVNVKRSMYETITQNKLLLWSIIAVALIILLLLTRQMVKAIDKRKQHDTI